MLVLFQLKRGIESYTISLANKLAEERRIKVVIYAWKGENKDFVNRLNDNTLIRTLPILRYFPGSIFKTIPIILKNFLEFKIAKKIFLRKK